jgi:signal transduction histidine kinase
MSPPRPGAFLDASVNMSLQQEADGLARELFEARRELRNAGCVLHDQAGALLSAAGLRLQLLRMDFPQAADSVDQVLIALDEAVERVRALSQALNPSPAAHVGLEGALTNLVAGCAGLFPGTIELSYAAAEKLPQDAAVAIYDAVSAVLERAMADGSATRITVSVKESGRTARKTIVQVVSNGRWRWSRREAAAEARRALPAGVVLDTTKQSTLVSISYAPRRATRR